MTSVRAHMFLPMAKPYKLFFSFKPPIKYQRAVFQSAAIFCPEPKEVSFKPVKAGNIEAAWLIPENIDNSRVVLFLHGGGYIWGTVEGYRKQVGHIAKVSGCRALSIGYRLAPEHKFPAPVEDAVYSYRWLLSEGYKPENIMIAGDSAGGGLTVATLVSLRDSGDPLPAGAVMISPWTDLEMTGESIHTMAKSDPLSSLSILEFASDSYVDEKDLTNPLASPMYADFKGLPPLLIMVGTREILLDDARRLAERAEKDGVSVDLEIAEGMWHIWPFSCRLIPESTKAMEKIGFFCRDKMSTKGTGPKSHSFASTH